MDTPLLNLYPVIPLQNSVLYPGVTIPVSVGRASSVAAIKAAKENWVAVIAQKKPLGDKEVTPEDLYRTGTIAKIERVIGNDDTGYQVLLRGVSRFHVNSLREIGGYLEAEGWLRNDEQDSDHGTEEALLKSMKTLAVEILDLLPADTRQLSKVLEAINDLSYLSHIAAANLDLDVNKAQEVLETIQVRARALKLLEAMQSKKENIEVQAKIRSKMEQKLSKNQKENLLREQMRAIREELGEGSNAKAEEDYRKKIEAAHMSPEAEKVALDELKRLETIGEQSPEAHVIRNYLDLLCAMPWDNAARQEIDLDAARKILDEEHYGLDRIKKRILQYLAVMKLKGNHQGGTILLFVGPPGVGKTSLGQSIAKALGRKFVRASLGGVRDDAEIRGHRRTYIGAMPGRIVQSLKRAEERNPVMMLDEIDKMASSYQGDPMAAMLEVLDPEQNSTFTDHYLDVPFDLSNVFFIGTANSLDTIRGPLLDRMEVIELSSYTTQEKFHIAKRHLVPKQLEAHGLMADQIEITDEALLRIIQSHTREAGVRELQRKIAEVLRGSAEEVLNLHEGKIVVGPAEVEEILGPERFQHEVVEEKVPPGVVTGLAWTPLGGEILFVESSLMSGGGNLTITGQLGDVMKESARIALSLARSRIASLALGFEYEKKDLHIHVPAGAVPKDGPSAGIALFTSIASLFTGKSIDPKTAMSGEVTLRGAVLPVGGIKEKVIAAHRAGIERVILSRKNEKDLKEVPEDVRAKLKFEFVDTVDDVLRLALGLPDAGTSLLRGA